MQEPRWTLDELAERVDTALAVDYHGQPSGRVRAVPDRRAIRWYTTIGLIDRPAAHRGRTALYDQRHLLQLVAVKRLQAKGLPLVAIQRELAGATDTELARVARLAEGARSPAQPPAVAPLVAGGTARRASFWRDRPAAAPTPTAADAGSARPAGLGLRGPATLQGVRLGSGATLLLEPGRDLAAADLDAILDAAGPLLAILRDRGLTGGAPVPDEGPDQRPGPDTVSDLRPDPLAGHEPRAARAAENEPRREHR